MGNGGGGKKGGEPSVLNKGEPILNSNVERRKAKPNS